MKYILILSVVLLTGCGKHWCEKHYPPTESVVERHDTLTEVRDTTIFIPGPTLYDTFKIECREGIPVIHGGDGTIRIVTRDNVIYAQAKCPDVTLIVKRYRQVQKIISSRVEVQVERQRYIPWWIYVLIAAAFAAPIAVRYAWKGLMTSV